MDRGMANLERDWQKKLIVIPIHSIIVIRIPEWVEEE